MNLSNTSLFWDTPLKNIDFQKHSRFVIERVLVRGRLSDWFEIKQYYGLDKIKQEALQIRSMDELTLNFCSVLFNIPKTKFRCYIQQASIQPH